MNVSCKIYIVYEDVVYRSFYKAPVVTPFTRVTCYVVAFTRYGIVNAALVSVAFDPI